MPNPYFQFKQFTVHHDRCAMKVTTDACLFGAWVAETVSALSAPPAHLLDIGTGSGLLSLMVAQKNSGAIDALEIEAAAAAQASENVCASPWGNRIAVLHQDVREWKPATSYTCIFSNPPFYESEIRSTRDSRNLAHHDDGLKLAELLPLIRLNLAEDGTFFLLLPAKREAEVNRLMKAEKFFLERKVRVQQTLKHHPFRIMIQGRRKKVAVAEDQTISIKDNAGAYTAAFVRLLQPYYLYLSMAS